MQTGCAIDWKQRTGCVSCPDPKAFQFTECVARVKVGWLGFVLCNAQSEILQMLVNLPKETKQILICRLCVLDGCRKLMKLQKTVLICRLCLLNGCGKLIKLQKTPGFSDCCLACKFCNKAVSQTCYVPAWASGQSMVGGVEEAEPRAFAAQRSPDHTRGGIIRPWHQRRSHSASASRRLVHLVSPHGSLREIAVTK